MVWDLLPLRVKWYQEGKNAPEFSAGSTNALAGFNSFSLRPRCTRSNVDSNPKKRANWKGLEKKLSCQLRILSKDSKVKRNTPSDCPMRSFIPSRRSPSLTLFTSAMDL